MAKVFISYARSTAAMARQVAAALRALGQDVWMDDELPAHRPYAEVIEERLDGADAVVVIWSVEAVKSQWVRSEADRARGAAKLVQMVLDGARLPMPFDQIQCADLAGWNGDPDHAGWRKVVSSVEALARPGSAPAPGPAPKEPARSAAPVEPLLAVLAFDRGSADEETAYFSDGVSQEILDTVARSAGLKVIGRASSFQLRGAAKSPANVAASLGATHVLDGSVRRAGPRVRISAELCACSDGRSLWSDRFDGEIADIFGVQDEIAAAVAKALKAVFAPSKGPAITVTPEAYEQYLRSRDMSRRLLFKERLVMAERAVALTPDFPAAWGWVAHLRAKYALFERGDAPFGPLEASAREAIERALTLDPGMGMARAAAAHLEPYAAYARRETLMDQALAAAPSDPVTLIEKSHVLSAVGRLRDALAPVRLAMTLDPNYFPAFQRYGILTLLAGDWGAGQAACDVIRARWPDEPSGVHFAASAAGHAGDMAKLDELARFSEDHGFNQTHPRVATILMFARSLPNQDQGFANLVQAVAEAELAKEGAAGAEKLYALAALGRVDVAFDLAERSSYAVLFESGAFHTSTGFDFDYLTARSHNRAMIDDPRFLRLAAKLGLVDYWVSQDRWPDCADETPYDFRAEARRQLA